MIACCSSVDVTSGHWLAASLLFLAARKAGQGQAPRKQVPVVDSDEGTDAEVRRQNAHYGLLDPRGTFILNPEP